MYRSPSLSVKKGLRMPRCEFFCRGLLLTLLLAACSAGKDAGIPPSASLARTGLQAGSLSVPMTSGTLYVANYYASTISVFSPGKKSPARTISSGISYPNSLTIDKAGNLYVGNYGTPSGSLTSSVSVYSPGSSQPARVIVNSVFGPFALAIDRSGKLYVANNGGDTVTVYARGSTSPTETLTAGIRGPEALAFDSSGNLYVANFDSDTVTMYAPGKTKVMKTFKRDLAGPASLAMDSANNLYVANQRKKSITIYPFLKPNHPQQITKGVAKPIAIISSAGDLYVLDYARNSLSAYDEKTLARIAVRSDGIQCPSAMTLSTTGKLFVTNSCPSGVSIYAASDLTLEGSINHGISYPVAASVSQ